LKKGETVRFRYRIVIENGKRSLAVSELNELATAFAAAK
jgi:hypothetical protein